MLSPELVTSGVAGATATTQRANGERFTALPLPTAAAIRAAAVRVLSVFAVDKPPTRQTEKRQNAGLFGMWAALVDVSFVFFKHEESGSGPALARRLLDLLERPAEAL